MIFAGKIDGKIPEKYRKIPNKKPVKILEITKIFTGFLCYVQGGTYRLRVRVYRRRRDCTAKKKKKKKARHRRTVAGWRVMPFSY